MTYITAAALSGLALVALSVLLVGLRLLRLRSEWQSGDMQFRILSLALDDESLRACVGPYTREELFTNVWLMHQRMRFLSGEGSAEEVAAVAETTFRTEPGRAFWVKARPHFLEHFTASVSDRRFAALMDGAHESAGGRS